VATLISGTFWSSVGRELLCSTHILSLKCLRLPVTKKRKASPNVKILVLGHPLADLGATYTVHVWLAGKRVINFLVVLIEFFGQLSQLRRNEQILVEIVLFERRRVILSANFRGRGGHPWFLGSSVLYDDGAILYDL